MKEQDKEILKQKIKEKSLYSYYLNEVIDIEIVLELIDSIPVTDLISKSHVLERLKEIEFKLVHLKYNFETIELDEIIDRIDQFKKEL